MGKVIAVDGPAGAGKSTVSKIVAERLGYTCLDTGAELAEIEISSDGLEF